MSRACTRPLLSIGYPPPVPAGAGTLTALLPAVHAPTEVLHAVDVLAPVTTPQTRLATLEMPQVIR